MLYTRALARTGLRDPKILDETPNIFSAVKSFHKSAKNIPERNPSYRLQIGRPCHKSHPYRNF